MGKLMKLLSMSFLAAVLTSCKTDLCYLNYNNKNYDRAIEVCSERVESIPAHYTIRALSYSHKGQYDLAISDYNRLIELFPKNDLYYNNRGVVFLFQGKEDLAFKDFSKAIELKPKGIIPHINRGIIYISKGEYALAAKEFDKAVELEPKEAFVYLSRGNLNYLEGKYELATVDYSKAIELQSNSKYLHMRLIIALHKSGKSYQKELEKLKELASKNNPDDQYISMISKYFIGEEVTETMILEEARKRHSEREINVQLSFVYYYFGEKMLMDGKMNEAKEFFKKSIETDAKYLNEYNQAKAILNKLAENGLK